MMKFENMGKKGLSIAMLTAALVVGAVAGSTVFGAHPSNAQTANTTQTVASPTPQTTTTPDQGGTMRNGGGAPGTFKSNEDPAHEAQESPQREAQENAGQFPTVK
jgi:flagellar basal body-associated protein FliL